MTSLERTVSVALRGGVLLAAVIVGVGGIAYLAAHGSEPASFGAPPARPPLGTSEQILAIGILVMIATPVIRVALLVIAFARQRDAVFVGLSAFVLAVLLVSLA